MIVAHRRRSPVSTLFVTVVLTLHAHGCGTWKDLKRSVDALLDAAEQSTASIPEAGETTLSDREASPIVAAESPRAAPSGR